MPAARRASAELEARGLIGARFPGGQDMAKEPPVLLLVSDRPVLSSLHFSLTLEGFPVADGTVPGSDPRSAATLVVDQGYSGDGLADLAGLRAAGCAAPAILLATNPTALTRSQTAAAGAVLIEKPLLGDDLTRALRTALQPQEAA
jgi:FixJ family two-component response regulator